MPSRPFPVFRLVPLLGALAAALLVSAACSGVAMASPWGDLGHFGEKESELRSPQPAFGVNPEDGSAWAVDDSGEELRLQKFEKQGGTWKAVASVLLGPVEGPHELEKQVEGVAFDQKEGRAYVLVSEERKGKGEAQYASELWAFSTTVNAGKIEPAAGTKGGVLVPRTETELSGGPVGKKEFAPDDKVPGMALAEPGGIAVDPKTDEILITGSIGKSEPELWAVSKEGEIKTVWQDGTHYFEEEEAITSPVVSSTGAVFVLGEKAESANTEVVELPSNLSSTTAPKRAFVLPTFRECVTERENQKLAPCPFYETVASMREPGEAGGSIAIGPEGDFYVHVSVKNANTGFEYGGVMVLGPAFEKIGWIGGGSWNTETKECAVREKGLGGGGAALLGAYKEHVFMFEIGALNEGEPAKVLELGPGGATTDCPPASASKPVAEALGKTVASFPIADTITLSAKLVQANSLSTEWEFEPGVTQIVSKDATLVQAFKAKTLVEHQFKQPGTFQVVAKIHTDDLATPLVETSEAVTVVAPETRGEQATVNGTGLALKGEVNPKGSATKCEFQVVEAGKEFSDPSAKKIVCPTNPGEEEKWVLESAEATGLTPGAHYLYRLLAKAGAWESGQAGAEIEVPASGAPVATTGQASEIAPTSATVSGSVNPKGKETTCKFEYGPTLPSGKFENCSTAPGKGETAVPVSAKLSGLSGGTAYKFKLIAESAGGKGEGLPPASFTTAKEIIAPSAVAVTPPSISQTTATLAGEVNPNGAETTCKFEYGTTASYGQSATCPAALSGSTTQRVMAAITGLAAGTSYHFRVTATNAKGTTQSADLTFKTAAASSTPPPPSPGTESPPPPVGKTEVLPETVKKFSPVVTVAGSAMTVASNGSFTVKLSCPKEETTCAGTVTLKTLTAVAAAHGGAAANAKKVVLTLASKSFSIVAGKVQVLTLHLSATARRVLAKTHTLRARATIVAHDSTGSTHTTTAIVTLKAAKRKH